MAPRVDLPPPAIFTRDETLHRILLPPLALFLSDLSAPDQLVKLNDILTRFRTPKSYHRVDVRLVESSELPPGEGADEPEASGSVKHTGRPVILPEGQDRPPSYPPTASTKGQPSPAVVQDSTPPTADPVFPLPPSAPARRIRELRLDLRTLDAAALFALESWRRELLGLEKLPMEHPDSIWYKDPSPPTPPSPPPSGKRRGRARKSRQASSVESGVDGANGANGADTVTTEAERAMASSVCEGPLTGESAAAHTALDSATQDTAGEPSPPGPSPRAASSPDVILDDSYDRREEADPEFVPERLPSARARRRGSARAQPARPVAVEEPTPSLGFETMEVFEADIAPARSKRPLHASEAKSKAARHTPRRVIESVTLDSLPGKRRKRGDVHRKRLAVSEEAAAARSVEDDDDEWGFLMDI